ncbi:MAG: DNA repair protein RecO [Idiomarina sp.]|nr:DNA repair protein RecO [Idiomarina sp.]
MTPAFILHRWPYQEHSALLEVFTREHGKIRLLAKGVQSAKSRWRGILTPFVLLDAEWRGRGELCTLTHADLQETFELKQRFLYSGFYLNELLQRILPDQFSAPELFDDYRDTLDLLQQGVSLEPVLRRFEWQLLERLDLGFSWAEDARDGSPISADERYEFYPEHGFMATMNPQNAALTLPGETVLALGAFQLDNPELLKWYKLVMRAALQPHLGSKPLRSRDLFSNHQSSR